MRFFQTHLKQIAGISCILAATQFFLGTAFTLSCAIVGLLFFAMERHIAKFSKGQKWLLAVASVVLVAPGNPWLALIVASIVAGCLLFQDLSPKTAYVAGLGCIATLAAFGVFVPDLAFADEGLGSMIDRIKNLASTAQAAAPYIGYAAGLGFGGTGLIEVVKSKNGQGGDFGGGMKKVLIGGGLASLGAIVDMAANDMGNEVQGKG